MASKKAKTIDIVHPKTGETQSWTAQRIQDYQRIYKVEVQKAEKKPKEPKENDN